MPNWTNNTLKIIGEEKTLKKFIKKAPKVEGKEGTESYLKTDLSLDNFYSLPKRLKNTISPMPLDTEIAKKTSKELIEKFGADNWYNWQVKNWGTKWDIEAELVSGEPENNELVYVFNSAWSPPIEWLKKVSKDYPDLKFLLDYEEEGMGFKGITKAQNGKIKDCYFDY